MDSEPFTLINNYMEAGRILCNVRLRVRKDVSFFFRFQPPQATTHQLIQKSISSPPKKMPEPVVQRIVPGAPPPTPLSKTQKKKRKVKARSAEPGDASALPEAASAAPTEKTPESPEIREPTLAPEVIAQSDSQMSLLPEEEVLLKPSPIVDLIHRRLKATTKKIVSTLVLSNTVGSFLFLFLVTDNCLCCYRP